jgi:NADH-quinone oxidoreductase subunit E
MAVNEKKILAQFMPADCMKDIDSWIAKYPADQRQSAVMSTLRIVQERHKYLTSELMDAVADYLNMPAIAVYEVASFYTMYEHEVPGRHIVNVCTNISCKLKDADAVMHHLQKKWGIQCNETTEDGRFTLRAVECLGACVNAPVVQVNKDYHENVSTKTIEAVLEQYP